MLIGPVMLDLAGTQLTAEEQELLRHPLVGGVILFTRNFEHPVQLRELTHTIRRANPSILIAIDQEGGRVQRLQQGFTRLPPLAYFGEHYTHSPQDALVKAEQAAYTMATEIKAAGIDISFAPVLDIDWGMSQIIGQRSFSEDPAVVAELARAYIRGMHKANMTATGKHFPGHGAVVEDSHISVPKDGRDLNALFDADLLPYRKLVDCLDAVMIAHIIYSAIDEQLAGFSTFWLQTILRQRLGFNGAIFSDDLTMAGARVGGGFPERADKAIQAGCDMILVCNNRQAAIAILDQLSLPKNWQGDKRVGRMLTRQAQEAY